MRTHKRANPTHTTTTTTIRRSSPYVRVHTAIADFIRLKHAHGHTDTQRSKETNPTPHHCTAAVSALTALTFFSDGVLAAQAAQASFRENDWPAAAAAAFCSTKNAWSVHTNDQSLHTNA